MYNVNECEHDYGSHGKCPTSSGQQDSTLTSTDTTAASLQHSLTQAGADSTSQGPARQPSLVAVPEGALLCHCETN